MRHLPHPQHLGTQPLTPHDDARAWFHAHPDRTYHCQLATPAEIAELRDAGAFDQKTLAHGCYVFALFHVVRSTSIILDDRLVVLEAGPTWDEAACCKVWHDCEQMERVMQ